MKTLGIYLHVPFCKRKCSYCDFYSLCDLSLTESYTNALKKAIAFYKDENRVVDTIYFGGGTPSLLTPSQIGEIIREIKNHFKVVSPETTIELNPCTATNKYMEELLKNGVNRLSIGVQSLNDNELVSLGRLHDRSGAVSAIKLAKSAGFSNVSADLMMGIPHQTQSSLLKTIEELANLDIQHISSYMLKIEKGTPFFENSNKLNLPTDDEVAEYYLSAVEQLEKFGFMQYEISNFSKPGYESRHNLKYWQLEDYLGLGPAAHSLVGKKRFYFERDIYSFIKMAEQESFSPTFDEQVNLQEEYIMLSLRLCKGLSLSYANSLGIDTENLIKKVTPFINSDFMKLDSDRLSFTKNGFLVSNTILSKII